MATPCTKILLVEDNSADRQFMDACIHDASGSIELHYAARLDEARTILDQQQFALVIVDLNLPDAEGMDTFFKVKELAKDSAIVVLTGINDSELANSALLAGAQDYLVKGDLSHEKVWQSVSNAIQRHTRFQRVSEEVHDLKTRNNNLRELAHVDPLTGLCNRRGLSIKLEQEREDLSQSLRPYALLIDVDNFKTVNDFLGYSQGDQVLKDVGRRIQKLLKSTDTGARVGGDEFVVLAHRPDREEAIRLAEDIRASIVDGNQISPGRPMEVTVSVGVVAMSRRTYLVEDLLELTQSALRLSKGNGKNRICFGGDERSLQRVPSEIKVTHYPYYEISSGQVQGNRFVLSGGIPIPGRSEQSNLGIRALLKAAELEKDSLSCLLELTHLQLMQLKPQDLLTNPQVGPRRTLLCIPTIPISPLPHGILDAVRQLQNAGWSIALSGFDLGPHSLANLILLEPSLVILNPALVTGVAEDQARFRVLLRLCRTLDGLETSIIAGGVTTPEDLRALERLGVNLASGPFFNGDSDAPIKGA